MLLTGCEIALNLPWPKTCVIVATAVANKEVTFSILIQNFMFQS